MMRVITCPLHRSLHQSLLWSRADKKACNSLAISEEPVCNDMHDISYTLQTTKLSLETWNSGSDSCDTVANSKVVVVIVVAQPTNNKKRNK